MKKKPPIYILDHKLLWRNYKKLHDKLVKDSGPTPMHLDKSLWKMMRDRQILCWFDPMVKGDMGIGLKPPDREYKILTNSNK